MRRLALAALLACAACKQQDAALMLNITGAFRVPQDANQLQLEIRDALTNQVIRGKSWCAAATAGCDPLPAMPSLAASLTVVESGAEHPHVKINAVLLLDSATVALDSVTTGFQSGQTVEVPIQLTPP